MAHALRKPPAARARTVPTMATEWHNYKSARTGQLAGAYFYLPQLREDNLAHVYQMPGGCLWYARSYIAGCPIEGGPFATFGIAKTEVARQICAHVRGPVAKQLVLNLPVD